MIVCCRRVAIVKYRTNKKSLWKLSEPLLRATMAINVHLAKTVGGDTCVVAVVRSKQQLIKGLTVSTFDSKGEKLTSEVPCDDGVVILRVPMDSEVVYAAVNFREGK